MNNKGFTLVELLGAIAIVGLVFGIASVSIGNTIENSKKRSEEIFVNEIDKAIDIYVSKYINNNNDKLTSCTSNCTVDGDKSKITEAELKNKKVQYKFTLDKLFSDGILIKDKFVNPRTKEKCIGMNNIIIYVYQDKNYVYNYEVSFKKDENEEHNFCHITNENAIISTLKEE